MQYARGEVHVTTSAIREFRPPVRTSVVRVVLAVLVSVVCLGAAGALSLVVFSSSRVTYVIGGGTLVVDTGDRFFGSRTLPLGEIVSVRVVSPDGGWRVSGAALPNYCIGRFRYRELGNVFQATDCRLHGLFIETKKSLSGAELPVFVTPPDVDDFRARLASGEDTRIALAAPDKTMLVTTAAIAVPLSLLVTVLFLGITLFGPSRMLYRVGGGLLEVRTVWTRKRWMLQGARVSEHVPERLFRIAGSAMPGYYTGLFRESGRTTRVYATTLERMVLVDCAARILLSPAHREELLAALVVEGATRSNELT